MLVSSILVSIRDARQQDPEAKKWLLEEGYDLLTTLVQRPIDHDSYFNWVTTNCPGKLRMSKSWIVVKHEILNERGYVCECCGKPQTSLEAHHTFIHRMKGHPELDCAQNASLVCYDCHYVTGKADSKEFFEDFWDKQSERYDMQAWAESLPLKVKLRYTP